MLVSLEFLPCPTRQLSPGGINKWALFGLAKEHHFILFLFLAKSQRDIYFYFLSITIIFLFYYSEFIKKIPLCSENI